MVPSNSFFQALPAISDFAKVTDGSLHTDLPGEWSIVITDVIGSTNAIAAGRYKEVNMVGAACIAAVVNVDKTIDVPFIFGGDGATFAIPPSLTDRVMLSLAGARNMARASFNLDLRVGLVPVKDLQARGEWVRIGKYQMSPHIFQPAFSGRGWELAERLVKDPEKGIPYRLKDDAPAGEADFTGLECRWKGVPAVNDCKLALLIVSTSRDASKHTETYRDVLSRIETTIGSMEQAHPIRQEMLSLNQDPSKFSTEAAIRTWGKSRWTRYAYQFSTALACAIGKILMTRKIDTKDTKWSEYLGDFVRNSDFRKFDGMLRMVIDCTNAQKKTIEDYLIELRSQGKVAFGMHASPQAIVTCLISSYNGYHTHFVDGSDGGYAMAAVQLKAQLKADFPRDK